MEVAAIDGAFDVVASALNVEFQERPIEFPELAAKPVGACGDTGVELVAII